MKQSMPGPARRFAFFVFLFFLPVLLAIALCESLFWLTGETWPVRKVIAAQQQGGGAWMRDVFSQDMYTYKWVVAHQRKPAILALGSSRVMKFRAEMFGKDGRNFYNGGGLVRSITDLERFEKTITHDSAPRVVILGVDHWWLNDNVPENIQVQGDAVYDWRAHVSAWRWCFFHIQDDGKVDKPRVPKKLVKAVLHPKVPEGIGISARIGAEAIRADGSVSDDEKAPASIAEWKFKDYDWLERLEKGVDDGQFAAGLSRQRLKRLEAVVRSMQSKGILVLAFDPPLISNAIQMLTTMPEHRNMWKEYRQFTAQLCASLGVPFCDATITQRLGMGDYAMRDAVHAEETFHLHILQQWLKDERVRRALPDTSRAVEAALKSPRTGIWQPDYGSSSNN